MSNPITCPACSGTTTHENFGSAFVDVCRECKGIWFDGGELERLDNRRKGAGPALQATLQVEPAGLEHMSPLEVGELPRELVMRTTNPILLAYRYARATQDPRLALTVTRHREVELEDATIDEADYRTLFTADGLAVTTARFVVRNHRKQFLRVVLPSGSEVWSASVAGRAETPAMAADASEDTLQEAYAQLSARLHPDRYAAQSQALRELAG